MIGQIRAQCLAAIEPVMARLREAWLPRYQQLEPREQRMLLIAAVILPLMVLVFAVLMPLHDRQLSLQSELTAAKSDAKEAQSLAKILTSRAASGQGGTGSNGTLLTMVEQKARETGVRGYMTRLKPQRSPGGGHEQLMLQIRSAPYTATVKFFHAIAGMRAGVKSIELKPAGKPGLVHVRAMIGGN